MSQPLPKYANAVRFERSTVDMAADRPILERSDLVLACAHVLHTNGQSTHETVQAAEHKITSFKNGAIRSHIECRTLESCGDGVLRQRLRHRVSPTRSRLEFIAGPQCPVIQVAAWLTFFDKFACIKNPVVGLKP